MKPITQEWVQKAEADFQTASRELRRRSNPNFDVTCFLAQQATEKYLKAQLQENSIVFGKTHDLEALGNQLIAIQPGIALLMPALKAYSAYAVVFRYPGRSATKVESKDAVALAQKVRQLIRVALGLPSGAAKTRKRVRSKSSSGPRRKARKK